MKNKKPSYVLLVLTVILVLVGLAVLVDVSAVAGQQKFNDAYFFLKHQLLYGIIPGLLLFFLAYRINLRWFKKYSLILLIICTVILLLVFLPQLGIKGAKAMRWINLGLVSFQPSEFLKIAFIIFMAAWLSDKTKLKIQNFKRAVLPFMGMLLAIGIPIILQPSTGTFLVIAIAVTVMFLVAGLKLQHLLIMVLIGAMLLGALIYLTPYRSSRVLNFLNPSADESGLGKSYQTKQAIIGIGSGGLSGLGLGKSVQKYNYLPESYSDAIFAIYAEEFGFIGVLLVIGLFLMFLFAGFQIARGAPDSFSSYLVTGLTSWIVVQAFINIAVSSAMIPVIGLPLPFFSAGGSALAVVLASVGLILNVSRASKQY